MGQVVYNNYYRAAAGLVRRTPVRRIERRRRSVGYGVNTDRLLATGQHNSDVIGDIMAPLCACVT